MHLPPVAAVLSRYLHSKRLLEASPIDHAQLDSMHNSLQYRGDPLYLSHRVQAHTTEAAVGQG